MRRAILTSTIAALLLCGCSPPAPPPDPPAAQPAQQQAALPSELQGALAEGAWLFEEGNIASSTGFGLPESESQFFIQCERGPRIVTLSVEHELAPDQDTTLSVVTTSGALDFPARSFNEGLPSVSANLHAPDPRLSALAATTDRFAVRAGDDVLRLPMDESARRVLALCGVS